MSGGNRLTSHRRACSVSGDMDLPSDNSGLTFASQADGTYIPVTSPGGGPSGAASPVPVCGDISEFVNYALATPCAPSPMGTVRHHAGANESPAVAAYYGASGEYASYSPYVYDRSPSPGIVPQIPMLQQQQQQQQQMMMLGELSEEEDGEKRRRTYTFFKERIESGRLMVQTDYPELSEMVNDNQKREQLGSVVGKAYGFLFDKKRFKLNNKTEESPFDFSKSPTGLLSYIPPSNIHRFVERIAKYVPLSAEALVLSLIYIDFLMERGILDVNSKNAQRVFATAFVTASKFAYDRVYSNKFYAKVTYLEVTELDDLEIEFLKLFKFNVTPSLDDWNSYASWIYSVAFPTTRPSPIAGLPYSPPLSPSSLSSSAATYYQQQQQQQQQNAIPQPQNMGVPTPFQLHPVLGSSYSGQSQLSSGSTAGCGNSASSTSYQDNLSFKNSQSPSKNNSITESPIKNNIKLNTENNKKHHKKSHKKRSAKNPDGENSSSSSSSGSCSGSSRSSSASSGSCSGSSRSSGSGSGSCSESCSGSSQSGSGTGSGSCSGSSSVTSSGSSTSSMTSSGSASSGSGSVISRSTTSSGSTTSSVLSNECRWNGKNPISVGESEGDLDESPVIERSKCKNTVDVLGTVRVVDEGDASDDDDESSDDFDDCEVIVHDTDNEEEETVDVVDDDDEEEEEEVVESEKSVGGV